MQNDITVIVMSWPPSSPGRTTRHSTPHMYEMAHWRRETLERTPQRSTPHITENLRDRMSVLAHEDESHDRTEEHTQKEGGTGRLAAPKKQQEDGVGVVTTSARRAGSRRSTTSSPFSSRLVGCS